MKPSGRSDPNRVTMLLENDLYPQDTRVRDEATSLARAGYAVHVIAPRGDGQTAAEVVDGVQVERFRAPIDHRGGATRLFVEYAVAHAQLYARAIRAILGGTDVLHAHNPPDTLFVPGLLGRRRGVRFVFDQHDHFPDLFEAKFGRSPALAIARAAQRASLRLADLVITTNESQRQEALERAACGGEAVIVVRNGPSTSALERETVERPGALEDPQLVYVGALESQDGVDRLPMLMSSLMADHQISEPHLTVVGWGSREGALMAEVDARGLANRVRFTGRVRHDRVLELVAGADICLDVAPCNPLNHRTTMVKVVEYLALGKPTVSFALQETVRTAGDAVAYAPCGDVDAFTRLVAELARSEARREELRARARALAPSLVWERSEQTLLDGYRLLTGSHKALTGASA